MIASESPRSRSKSQEQSVGQVNSRLGRVPPQAHSPLRIRALHSQSSRGRAETTAEAPSPAFSGPLHRARASTDASGLQGTENQMQRLLLQHRSLVSALQGEFASFPSSPRRDSSAGSSPQTPASRKGPSTPLGISGAVLRGTGRRGRDRSQTMDVARLTSAGDAEAAAASQAVASVVTAAAREDRKVAELEVARAEVVRLEERLDGVAQALEQERRARAEAETARAEAETARAEAEAARTAAEATRVELAEALAMATAEVEALRVKLAEAGQEAANGIAPEDAADSHAAEQRLDEANDSCTGVHEPVAMSAGTETDGSASGEKDGRPGNRDSGESVQLLARSPPTDAVGKRDIDGVRAMLAALDQVTEDFDNDSDGDATSSEEESVLNGDPRVPAPFEQPKEQPAEPLIHRDQESSRRVDAQALGRASPASAEDDDDAAWVAAVGEVSEVQDDDEDDADEEMPGFRQNASNDQAESDDETTNDASLPAVLPPPPGPPPPVQSSLLSSSPSTSSASDSESATVPPLPENVLRRPSGVRYAWAGRVRAVSLAELERDELAKGRRRVTWAGAMKQLGVKAKEDTRSVTPEETAETEDSELQRGTVLESSVTRTPQIDSFLKSIPILQRLSEEQLQRLVAAFSRRQYAEGAVVVRQGEEGQAFYIVEEGEAEVLVRGIPGREAEEEEMGVVVNRLGSGLFFGERALITDQPRNATVRAKTDATLLCLARAGFTDILSNDASLLGDYPGSKANDSEVAQEIQSLTRHIARYRDMLDQSSKESSSRRRDIDRGVLRAMSAFAPELEEADVVERLIKVLYAVTPADNVALLTITPRKDVSQQTGANDMLDGSISAASHQFYVRVSRCGRGEEIPLQCLPGATALDGEVMAAHPAQEHEAYSKVVAAVLGYDDSDEGVTEDGLSGGSFLSSSQPSRAESSVLAVPVFSPLAALGAGAADTDARSTGTESPRATLESKESPKGPPGFVSRMATSRHASTGNLRETRERLGNNGNRQPPHYPFRRNTAIAASLRTRRLSMAPVQLADLHNGHENGDSGALVATDTAGSGQHPSSTPRRRVIAVLLLVRSSAAALARAGRRASASSSVDTVELQRQTHVARGQDGVPAEPHMWRRRVEDDGDSRTSTLAEDGFSADEARLAAGVADQIGFAMEHTQLATRAAAVSQARTTATASRVPFNASNIVARRRRASTIRRAASFRPGSFRKGSRAKPPPADRSTTISSLHQQHRIDSSGSIAGGDRDRRESDATDMTHDELGPPGPPPARMVRTDSVSSVRSVGSERGDLFSHFPAASVVQTLSITCESLSQIVRRGDPSGDASGFGFDRRCCFGNAGGVLVEARLYHGRTPLCRAARTSVAVPNCGDPPESVAPFGGHAGVAMWTLADTPALFTSASGRVSDTEYSTEEESSDDDRAQPMSSETAADKIGVPQQARLQEPTSPLLSQTSLRSGGSSVSDLREDDNDGACVFDPASGPGALHFPIRVCDIPRAARVVITVRNAQKAGRSASASAARKPSKGSEVSESDVHGKDRDKTKKGVLAWATVSALSFHQALLFGHASLPLWEGQDVDPMATTGTNTYDKDAPTLVLKFPKPPCPIIYGARSNMFGQEASSSQSEPSSPISRSAMRRGSAAASAAARESMGREAVVAKQRVFDMEETAKLVARNPLSDLSARDKSLLWGNAPSLSGLALALPKVVRATPWHLAAEVRRLHALLHVWEMPDAAGALELLGDQTPDPKVRAYAVQCLERLSDKELRRYMPQLAQVLKYERFHDSALARFLLRRALASPRYIGHIFFWLLKSEMHVRDAAARYGVLLEIYLNNCGAHRGELGHQQFVMQKLEGVARMMQTEAGRLSREAANKRCQEALQEIAFPRGFQLPLSPDKQLSALIVESCRVMDSKKKPLFLVFSSARAGDPPVRVLFKAGDDLRQDQLTMQVLRVMQLLWQEAGVDTLLAPYTVISTGFETGMIEVVPDAVTVSSIVASAQVTKDTLRRQQASVGRGQGTNRRTISVGKFTKALNAFRKETAMRDWLLVESPRAAELQPSAQTVDVGDIGRSGSDQAAEDGSHAFRVLAIQARIRASLNTAIAPVRPGRVVAKSSAPSVGATQLDDRVQSNFIRSCAGYCVATYVLGIGDRHPSNMMVTRAGRFFHIDFGHFLGNFKSKLGVKRERTPFVFTPAFAHVMGGEDSSGFRQFEDLCCSAYCVLRANADLLLLLFSLMISCRMPELMHVEDVHYLRDRLRLDLDDERATQEFRRLIRTCLNTRATQLNDFFHIYKHA